ncbi:MAG: hypothetical protein HY540_08160 [Deltaproteobacteria bacterium]|nr:hypothetical protein [Deltaproteobacteria bacterium]
MNISPEPKEVKKEPAQKKSLWQRLIEKIDRAMVEKSKQAPCCGPKSKGGKCC